MKRKRPGSEKIELHYVHSDCGQGTYTQTSNFYNKVEEWAFNHHQTS